MKKIYFLFALLFTTTLSFSQNEFITTWEVTNFSKSITIYTHAFSSQYNYNYTIDFGDGTINNNVTGDKTHTYSTAGIYTVKITGSFPSMIQPSNTYNADKLKSVEQWGNIQWLSMEKMFWNCTNMVVNATDSPDLSQVADMSEMFSGCDSFNQNINYWDVSNVTDMNKMFLGCYNFNQPLNSWNVSNVTDLSEMFYGCDFFNQNINNWDVSNVTDMSSMFGFCINFNQPLNSWDVSNVTNMDYMFNNCDNFNQPLNSWDVSNVTVMTGMFNSCDNFNQPLDAWDFTSNISFYSFLSFTDLDVTNYDALLMSFTNQGISNLTLGANGLEYCNTVARDYLISQGWNFNGDSLSANCDNIYASISGTVYYDFDNNGCSTSDISVNNFQVQAEQLDGDTLSIILQNANYEIPAYNETQTVSLINLPSYFTAIPQSQTVDFSTTSTEQVDFCITANQVVEDLNITILSLDDARPGFESNYKLIVQNVGTETLNAVTANVVFDNTKQSFVSANPTATSTTANTLDFSIGTIQPFGSAEVEFVMQNFTPPTVNADDVLTFTATVLPDASDYTPNDNVFTLDQIVVNAYDPNDKRVLQGDEITMSQTTDYLDYIIRFQNTGSANATFVRIEDILDTELDWSTLKITSASHTYDVKITNSNEVEFLFDNINLAYEAADEPNSHGYIAYKIKPKPTVQLGDVFSGDASIYFDYNLPIITNTVSTTIVNNLSTDEFSVSQLISIYPNPVKEGLFLNTKNGVSITSAKIYDLKGNKLIDINNSVEYINTEALSSGIYLLSVQTNQGKISKKIIKK